MNNMKKSSILISIIAAVLIGGGAIVFAHYKKSDPVAPQVAIVQPVQEQPVMQTVPVPTSQDTVPVVATSAPALKPKAVTVKTTTQATVVSQPVAQPTPQPVTVATPPPAPVAPTPAPEATSMTQVLNLSTSTDHKESDTFTMKGTKWRIDYSCSFTDNTDPYSLFNMDIKSTDGSIDKNLADLVTDCPTSNNGTGQHSVTLTNQTTGDYYLDVGLNDNITYNITVWDFR
jgi:hypothetical protein